MPPFFIEIIRLEGLFQNAMSAIRLIGFAMIYA